MLGDFRRSATGAFGSSKDSLIASGLKPAIQNYLLGIGAVESVNVDTTQKTARLVLRMHGEDRPVEVLLERYSIEPNATGSCLVAHEFSCPSHPWLAALAKKFNEEIQVELPVPFRLASNIL